jgi:hypothetical protein
MPAGTSTFAVGNPSSDPPLASPRSTSPELVVAAEEPAASDTRPRRSARGSSSTTRARRSGRPFRTRRRPRNRASRPSSRAARRSRAFMAEVEVRTDDDELRAREPRRGPRSRSPPPARRLSPRRNGSPPCGRQSTLREELELLLEVGQLQGAESGRTTVAGWRSKVTTSVTRPSCVGSLAQARRSIWWPRWTPS